MNKVEVKDDVVIAFAFLVICLISIIGIFVEKNPVPPSPIEIELVEVKNELQVTQYKVNQLTVELHDTELIIDTLHDEIVHLNQVNKVFPKNIMIGEEFDILCRIVEAEATGGSFDSKVNVTNVILNRVAAKNFPNTIGEVVFQNRQFSPIKDGRFYTVTLTESTLTAVQYALVNADTTNGALYFMYRAGSDDGNVTWFDTNLECIMKDELGHEFFR